MKTNAILALLSHSLLLVPTADAVVTFDWATVGNPGNAGMLAGVGIGGGHGPVAVVGSVNYTYRISKHEVTTGQYTEFLNGVAASDPYGLYSTLMWSSIYGCKIERSGIDGSYSYQVAADRKNRPVNFVSWGDAARFSNWLHNGQPIGPQDLTTTEDGAYLLNGAINNPSLLAVKREAEATHFIPSEDEWHKAAYYDPTKHAYFYYPASTNDIPRNDLINPDPGNNVNCYQSGYTIGSPYYTTEVGEFENSKSPYGTFDQGGNVWEWNEAILYGPYRGLRGGAFDYWWDGLQATVRHYGYPATEDYFIGFRVASILPEPGSIMLLLCAMVPVLLRGKGWG